jgi:hypothetical protein
VDTNPVQLTADERIALLDADLAQIREQHTGTAVVFVGGQDEMVLWYATVDAFAAGNWVATVLCAQATCERILAELTSLMELPGLASSAPKGWEDWGMGPLIRHIRNANLVPSDLLDEVQVLCDRRKPLGHYRRPLAADTVARRVSNQLVLQDWDKDWDHVTQELLADDAAHAARTALALHFGDYFAGPFTER